MKEIKCINFVSQEAPNVLLIGAMENTVQDGYYLKHFKDSHNIYIAPHQLDDNYSFYEDLPSKHGFIEEQLNKHNLYNFIVSSLSFGGLLAFYLIFHFPQRVQKAFIHDYTYHITFPMKVPTNLTNWKFTPSDIPICFYLFKGTGATNVKKAHIKDLLKLCNKINFILVPQPHLFVYELKSFRKNFIFILLNGFHITTFWNKYYKLWILNKYSFKLRKLPLLYFIHKHKKYL